MKILTGLLYLLMFTANPAFAHTDHALGEGTMHNIFHAIFAVLLVAVIVSFVKWIRPILLRRTK